MKNQLGVRGKFLALFACFFLVTAIALSLNLAFMNRLGKGVEVILRENQNSVEYCGTMERALFELERITLSPALGPVEKEVRARGAFVAFQNALSLQQSNITEDGESHATQTLARQFQTLPTTWGSTPPRLFPGPFEPIRESLEIIRRLNTQAMYRKSERAKKLASTGQQAAHLAQLAGPVLLLIFYFLSNRWLLRPLRLLAREAKRLGRREWDGWVNMPGNDELAQLSRAFNQMAQDLKAAQELDQAQSHRIQESARLALASIPNPVWVLDEQGCLEYQNPKAEILFGLPLGYKPEWPWAKEAVDKTLSRIPYKNDLWAEPIQVFENGAERFFVPQAFPIDLAGGAPGGVTLVLVDVTGLRREIETDKDWTAVVSHELKTPLTSLEMAIHILSREQTGDLNPTQTDLVLTARDSTQRLRQLVENLLKMHRLEEGSPLQKVELSPDSWVLPVIDHFRGPSLDKRVTLILPGPEIWKGLGLVHVDPLLIPIALENLLSNALKFCPTGGQIALSIERKASQISISVSDNGPGIPKANQHQIFEKFFRVPGQIEPGAGMGLAIAREIAQRHGGTLTFEDKGIEGTGSSFHLILPAFG